MWKALKDEIHSRKMSDEDGCYVEIERENERRVDESFFKGNTGR